MVYSAQLYFEQSDKYLTNQLIRIFFGLVALAVGYLIPLKLWRRWPVTLTLLVVITLALVLTLKFGAKINNARRQLFGIQFSELAKPVVVLVLACYYGMRERPSTTAPGFRQFVLYPLFLCFPAICLIACQPAVSMAAIVALIIVVLMYVAEVRIGQLFLLGAISGLIILGYVGARMILPTGRVYAAQFTASQGVRIPEDQVAPVSELGRISDRKQSTGHNFEHIEKRLRAFGTQITRTFDIRHDLDRLLAAERNANRMGIEWQQEQSRIAIGSGGWFGLGLGKGKQKFAFLPMVATDFIFALIGEELGFMGSLVIFSLYLVFLLRGMFLIRRAQDTFDRLLMSGVVVMIVVTAIIHLFVALRLVPPTGQALPFVSYGAAAMVANMFGVGLLLQASKYIYRRPIENDLVSRIWNRGTHLSGFRLG